MLCVAFRSDNIYVGAGGMDNVVNVWSVDKGERVAMLKGHTKWVTSVVW